MPRIDDNTLNSLIRAMAYSAKEYHPTEVEISNFESAIEAERGSLLKLFQLYAEKSKGEATAYSL